MKEALFTIATLFVLLFSSCSDKDEPINVGEGSNRDWTYTGEQVKVFIEDIEQPQVQEITVVSRHLDTEGDNPPFPWYVTTLKIKGLLSKNSICEIEVFADVERFEGTATVEGTEYDVSGTYTGSPFDHHKDMGIIVNLNKR